MIPRRFADCIYVLQRARRLSVFNEGTEGSVPGLTAISIWISPGTRLFIWSGVLLSRMCMLQCNVKNRFVSEMEHWCRTIGKFIRMPKLFVEFLQLEWPREISTLWVTGLKLMNGRKFRVFIETFIILSNNIVLNNCRL